MNALLWIGPFLLMWTSVGYFFFIKFLSRKYELNQNLKSSLPFSIVLIVHNAEEEISEKIKWCLNVTDPLLEKIFIFDDGSTDATKNILKKYSDPRLEISFLPRGGKSQALNHARKNVATPIVVFLDVRQSLSYQDLNRLCANVGERQWDACSGRLIPETGSKEYWDFEAQLRFYEGLAGVTIGLSGCACAMKKNYWALLPENCLADDLALGLGVLSRGGRVGFDPEILVKDPIKVERAEELKRKVRTLSGNWQIIFQRNRYFLPRNGFPKWALIQHKWLRVLLPVWTVWTLGVCVFHLENTWFVVLGSLFLIILKFKSRTINFTADFFWLNMAAFSSFFKWERFSEKGYWDPQGLKSK